MVIIYMPAAYAPTAVRSFQAPLPSAPASASRLWPSHRKRPGVMTVWHWRCSESSGRSSRSAKLPGSSDRPSGVTAAELRALA
jgi:hypothetical protein